MIFVTHCYVFQFTKPSLYCCLFVCLFTVGLRPNAGHGLLIHEVSRSHSTTHHSRQDSSGRLICSSQRPLETNNTHNRQTPMPPVGFEPTISASERPQTYAFDCTATGTGQNITTIIFLFINCEMATKKLITHKTQLHCPILLFIIKIFPFA